MSKIKISSNLFLEVNELKRLIEFNENGYKKLVNSIVRYYGIVQDTNNTGFKVSIKPGTSNVIQINPGLAYDSELNAIYSDSITELTINNTGYKKWIILSYDKNNYEKGTVSINTDGSLIGNGTEFLSHLRGQPNFPTKVKFNSLLNDYEYEVVNVESDNSALLSGDFTPEQGLKYSVIGTFTPGFQPLDSDKQIYEFDSFKVSLIDSNNVPDLTENQFIISSITFNESGVMSVKDERSNYIFNASLKQNIANEGRNILTSLLSAKAVSGVNSVDTKSADIELLIDHGYNVSTYELVYSANTTIVNIVTGDCNFLGTGNILDNIFKDWIILNRKNMIFSKIESNVNKALYIPNLDSSLFEANNNEIIIIPDYSNIEFEVKVSGNLDYPNVPFYFKRSIENNKNRFRFHIYMPSVDESYTDIVNVKIRYRMLKNSIDKFYPFYDLAVASYNNISGLTEILSSSSFNVNMLSLEPVEKTRNYS